MTAPVMLQENYDNSGLIFGNPDWEIENVLISLDCTEEVVNEAIKRKCGMIISHHPLVFGGLKKIKDNDYVGKALIPAIKNNVAIYVCHTNLDNVIWGVNGKIAEKLGLKNCEVLLPKEDQLRKIVTFCPTKDSENVRNAMFSSGAGKVGKYDECSFNLEGNGTFRAGEGTNPHVGEKDKRHTEAETRIEVIYRKSLETTILNSLFDAHPYEVVAYDLYSLQNSDPEIGSGAIGELDKEMETVEFLNIVKKEFKVQCIRHTEIVKKNIRKVAVCGGSGSFLINVAKGSGADIFITGDVKYHQFFDANGEMVIADIGHYESEQFTVELIHQILSKNFPTFAFHFSEVNTNPVNYL